MKHIIGAFSTLLIVVVNVFLGTAMITVSSDVAAAREYKAAVVAEIENSNFNPNVIAGCIEQAAALGYDLQVESCEYDKNSSLCTAEVTLTYTYEIPVFGIKDTKSTRGIAR